MAPALLLTTLLLTAAAITMQVGLLWVTVSHPLAAIWLLAGLLIAARGVRRRRARPGIVPASPGVSS